jgi:teichuronic acid biosynthesis glycosyltransferase TuaG
MESRLVSIIMPCFKCTDVVTRSIKSVIAQTHPNWELICIIDGQDNSLYDEIRMFVDLRIRVIVLEQNKGAAIARNIGIDNARGEFIAFIDADDVWLKNKIELQLSFMIKHGATASCTYVDYGHFSGRHHSGHFQKKYQKSPNLKYTSRNIYDLLIENKICTSSVMLKSNALHNNNFPNVRHRHDIILWCLLLKKGITFVALPLPLVRYDIGTKGISSNKLKMIKANYLAYLYITQSKSLSFVIIALTIIKRVILEINWKLK